MNQLPHNVPYQGPLHRNTILELIGYWSCAGKKEISSEEKEVLIKYLCKSLSWTEDRLIIPHGSGVELK